MTDKDNPFSALLSDNNQTSDIRKDIIEEVFLITLRKELTTKKRSLLSLSDVIVNDCRNGATLGEEILSHALFERLMLSNPEEYLLPVDEISSKQATEKNVLLYLYRAYEVCQRIQTNDATAIEDCDKITNLIITNVSTCVRQPEVFGTQSFPSQWLDILKRGHEVGEVTREFLIKVVLKIIAEVDQLEALGAFKTTFYPLLKKIQKEIYDSNIINLKGFVFNVLNYFVSDKRASMLGEVLIDLTTPNPNAKGSDYMNTLFGQMLTLSIMPKNSNGPYEFFSDITTEHMHSDPSLWQFMASHQNAVFILFKNLLMQGSTTKKKMLQWIGNCLHANVARGHLWSNINVFDHVVNQNASDSFMIGLCAVLLRLCEPLCHPNLKVLLVDPTYCAVENHECQTKQVNMLNMSEETCLLAASDDKKRMTAEKYNFVTEIFYMTHKAFELSYSSCIERYIRMTRELHNLQTAYQDVANTDPNNDLAKNLFRMLKEQLQKFLCMRNALMEPENDTLILKFFESSSIWLTEIALRSEDDYVLLESKKDFSPHKQCNMKLSIEPQSFHPPYLSSVPENIIDNISAYLNFCRHFPPGQFIEVYQSSHDAFFKMIVLFMGSAELVRNPHLRAKLAEALEFLLPNKPSGSMHTINTHVFDNHEDRLKVVRSILNVFVSIEMTGQSVQFEQKFNYRRPMYSIMAFLWTREDQVQCFQELANEAEVNMEAIEPPLFLRFINLLINDAIFLLDESLSNLEQIRQLQEAQANGEWNLLPHNERQQHISNLQHLGMLARFDNILGRDTINMLKLLTTEITSIFCHNSMVDRMASMLNYFLLNLVGPQKEKFKVKDKKEYEFDPAQTVLEICNIYVNLSNSDSFCLAVSQDGRSYSSQLFKYAEIILIRIGGGQLIGEISEFAAKVERLELEYKKDQEFIADAPDEYLDPIMSTLMTDPVILPSSNVTVDRSTIARHLLSDQTDPFNRAPLTMDKVKSNKALKEAIHKWIADKRSAPMKTS